MQIEQVISESDDSGDALAERYIKPKPISLLLCKLRSFNNS